MKNYCIRCMQELQEDFFKTCPNQECARFGLVTAIFVAEDDLEKYKAILAQKEHEETD